MWTERDREASTKEPLAVLLKELISGLVHSSNDVRVEAESLNSAYIFITPSRNDGQSNVHAGADLQKIASLSGTEEPDFNPPLSHIRGGASIHLDSVEVHTFIESQKAEEQLREMESKYYSQRRG